jgi:hypothetical protein
MAVTQPTPIMDPNARAKKLTRPKLRRSSLRRPEDGGPIMPIAAPR